MAIRIVSASQVRDLLPMKECIDAMDMAMRAASGGSVTTPPRLIMPLFDQSAYFGLMPGSARSPNVYGAKVVSLHPANPAIGLPAIQGFITLFDHDRGHPIAIIEGGEITAIRTAAASGLASNHLAREDARTHGVFGTGVQAVTHIQAINEIRPIEKIIIWGRDFDKAMALAEREGKNTGVEIIAAKTPEEAAACDIVSVVTGSAEPVIKGDWIAAGAHINLVGAHSPTTREADSDLIAKSSIFTDLLESLFNESGDILLPINEGRIDRSHIKGEIGHLLMGKIDGRKNDDEITVYKSLGITAQDLFAAYHVYEKAIQSEIGIDVSL